MAIEINVPRLGWSMEEGTFAGWLKQEGEYVREGEPLFVLESDKATQEIESFDAGFLRIPSDAPQLGETVRVGQRLGYLCKRDEPAPSGMSSIGESQAVATPDSDLQEYTSEQLHNGQPFPTPSIRRRARELGIDLATGTPAVPKPDHARGELTSAATDACDPQIASGIKVSPRAARAATKLKVNLSEVVASGTSGRICERDVLSASEKQAVAAVSSPAKLRLDARAAEEAQPSSHAVTQGSNSIRHAIASRMLAASQQTASVTLTANADADALVDLRQQFKNTDTPAPSFTSLFVKLAAVALGKHSTLLGQWSEQGVVLQSDIHVAVAVDTSFGLLTPVLRDVHAASIDEINERLILLISRARARKLSVEELTGGTFTITNLGSYRVDAFTPLLNLPQSAILGIGQISMQPRIVNGHVEARHRVPLSLTFDHRVADGAAAAALLSSICEYVENPLPSLMC